MNTCNRCLSGEKAYIAARLAAKRAEIESGTSRDTDSQTGRDESREVRAEQLLGRFPAFPAALGCRAAAQGQGTLH